jgi:hypothetical protein
MSPHNHFPSLDSYVKSPLFAKYARTFKNSSWSLAVYHNNRSSCSILEQRTVFDRSTFTFRFGLSPKPGRRFRNYRKIRIVSGRSSNKNSIVEHFECFRQKGNLLDITTNTNSKRYSGSSRTLTPQESALCEPQSMSNTFREHRQRS